MLPVGYQAVAVIVALVGFPTYLYVLREKCAAAKRNLGGVEEYQPGGYLGFARNDTSMGRLNLVASCYPLLQLGTLRMTSRPHIAVIGAGAFGGWTALHLLERGARVTLIDAWGPGNSRSSSGGETRVMRGTYGPDQPYTNMAARALELWAKYERRWKRRFLHRNGVLWMASGRDDAFERGSIDTLRSSKVKLSATWLLLSRSPDSSSTSMQRS